MAVIALPAVAGKPTLARELRRQPNIFAPATTSTPARTTGVTKTGRVPRWQLPLLPVATDLIAHNPGLNTPALLSERILDTAIPGLFRNSPLLTPDRFLYNGGGQ